MCPNQTLVSKFMSVLFCHSFLVQILVSRYRMALNHTQESKVMAVWICLALPCLISASRYIMRPNWTSEWNVMTIWISQELLWFNFERFHISWASIIHLRQKLWPFEFVESFWIFQNHLLFNCRQYEIRWDAIRTPESKVMAVWICFALPCLIMSMSIYYRPESDIRVKR